MKRILFISLALLSVLACKAQAPADSVPATSRLPIFDEMEPGVTVHQSESVNRLLTTRVLGSEQENTTIGRGYRIQFFSSNNPKTASAESSKVAEQLRSLDLGFDIYRTYNAPFWKVRVGNFLTPEEAQEALDELLPIIRQQKPELLENGGVYVTHEEEVILTDK